MPRGIAYVLTNDSIQIAFPGDPITINESHENFDRAWGLLAGLRGKPITDSQLADDLRQLVSLRAALEGWSGGGFLIKNGKVLYNKEPVPLLIQGRILAYFEEGDRGWVALANFWARLQRNPDRRSVEQLPEFLRNKGIPLDIEGYLYAYKGLTADYMDQHSRRYRSKPGDHNYMRRNQVSSNSDYACDHGFHVGTFGAASSYGPKKVIVRVDPADVVRVPRDGGKMGVNQYWSVADATDTSLPDALWEPGDPKYCSNYVKPDKVCLSYDIVLKKVGGGDAERGRLCSTLQEVLGFSQEVALAVVRGGYTRLATGLEGQAAAEIVALLRGGNRTGASGEISQGTLIVLEGVPSEAIDPLAAELKKPNAPSAPKESLRQAAAPPAPDTTGPWEAPKKPATPPVLPAWQELPRDRRPDLDKENRASLRILMRTHFPPVSGYSKWGASELRKYMREHWAKVDAKRQPPGFEDAEDEGVVELADDFIEPIEADEPKASDVFDNMGRAELRNHLRPYKVPLMGKLSASHLRKLAMGLETELLDLDELQSVPRTIDALRKLLDDTIKG
jgi:hypothetical protein